MKKCFKHGYTLKAECPVCKQQTNDVHYKFLDLVDAKLNPSEQSQT